jgi:hypothetical protein
VCGYARLCSRCRPLSFMKRQVECDSTKSKSWSWVEVTEGLDTAFYADTIVVVPRHATELTIESSSYRNFNGTVNVRAPVAYPGDQIRIDIRAFHRDRRYLEKIGVCRPSQSIRPGPAALLFRVRPALGLACPASLKVPYRLTCGIASNGLSQSSWTSLSCSQMTFDEPAIRSYCVTSVPDSTLLISVSRTFLVRSFWRTLCYPLEAGTFSSR